MKARTAALLTSGASAVVACTLLVDSSGLAEGQGAADDSGAETAAQDAMIEGATADVTDARSSCPPQAIFCETFETRDLRKWKEKSLLNGSLTVVEGADAGLDAAELVLAASITPKPNPDGGFLETSAILRAGTPRIVTGTIALRGRMLARNVATGLQLAVASVVVNDGQRSITMAVTPQGLWRVAINATKYDGKSSSVAVPIGRWVCMELVITLGTDGGVVLFQDTDPSPVLEYATDTVGVNGGFGGPYIGYELVSVGLIDTNSRPEDVFMDDIVLAAYPDTIVDRKPRIGCD